MSSGGWRPNGRLFWSLTWTCIYLSTLTTRALIETQQPENQRDTQSQSQHSESGSDKAEVRRDLLWPNRQLNVMIDPKSLNQTEQQIVAALFDQIEHKSCIRINRLSSALVNPFDTRSLNESERNFVYIFKSHLTGNYNRHTYLGLSTFGCLQQGRQSMVLTDLAFRWPELVLRYHVLRALGVESLERPDGQVRRLLNMLPLSQKIASDDSRYANSELNFNPAPTYFAYSTLAGAASMADPLQQQRLRQQLVSSSGQRDQVGQSNSAGGQLKAVQYLSKEDLDQIKQLYNCTTYQNKLSLKPLAELNSVLPEIETPPSSVSTPELYTGPLSNASTTDQRLHDAEASLREMFADSAEAAPPNADQSGSGKKVTTKESTSSLDAAAKSIVNDLLSDTGQQPSPVTETYTFDGRGRQVEGDTSGCSGNLDSCPLERAATEERPMMLKLDPFHARDPQLQQANQMKLSKLEINNSSLPGAPDWVPQLYQQPPPALLKQMQEQHQQQSAGGTSEMMISFEQADQHSSNPVAALASSKVLKLCSCTCQTMTPGVVPAQPPSSTTQDSHLPLTDERPTTSTTALPPTTAEVATEPPTTTTSLPPTTTTEAPPPPPPTTTTEPPTTTTEPPPTTTTAPPPPPPTTTIQPEPEPTSSSPATEVESPTPSETTEQPPESVAQSTCDQVQWVKPNKTVYASSKIVWDVDRANRNYFLCNNLVNGELVPGKTHGLSCEVSSEGKAYQNHEFNVLVKPEQVNLAWVQRNSDSFGTSNLPVVGGFSKQQDPYLVSRCLVRDENNDVITLIGYVNNQGIGWFPFDDIQIECAQYDVLACVS